LNCSRTQRPRYLTDGGFAPAYGPADWTIASMTTMPLDRILTKKLAYVGSV